MMTRRLPDLLPALPVLLLSTVLLSTMLTLTGCAQSPASGEREYLLPSAARPAAVGHLKVRVRVAGYLDQGGLVLQTGPTTLTRARSHRWAEPVGRQLERALSHHLAGQHLAGTLSVRITRFQGSADGDAHVSGNWRYQGGGDLSAGGTFDQRQPLRRDGYEELVDRLDAAWAAVAAGIRRELQ